MTDYFTCPHCSSPVDFDALSCPECGSDNETGWSETAVYDELDIYDDEGLSDNPGVSRAASKRRFRLGVIAILTFILSAFIASTIPWGIYLIPLIIVAAIIAYYLVEIAPNLRSQQEKKIYESLLLRARGDEAMVERWISYERQRTPDADNLDLMEAALYRWQRDNM
ncbi:MAG: zinc ribbon domain-containing protein [Candidatus Promineifilaceae bacterium]|nr:zinc ribbon domain-containing protein [Candidatus Promineifilaceae bacterium]